MQQKESVFFTKPIKFIKRYFKLDINKELQCIKSFVTGIYYCDSKPKQGYTYMILPDPENKHDDQAMRITSINKKHVGFVPRTLCATLLPFLDCDQSNLIFCYVNGKVTERSAQCYYFVISNGPKLFYPKCNECHILDSSVALYPCLHDSFCKQCIDAETITTCPTCNNPVFGYYQK